MTSFRPMSVTAARLPRRALQVFNSPQFLLHYHGWTAVFWAILIIPSYLWWHDSVFWVIVVSLYANLATEWGAWQAVRAEMQALKATPVEEDRVANETVLTKTITAVAALGVQVEALQASLDKCTAT